MSERLALPIIGAENHDLPLIEPYITGLQPGEVRQGADGRLQVYFGGTGIEHLTMRDSAALRDGAVKVDMFTIDGRSDVDYALITVSPAAASRTSLERAHALRFGGTSPSTLVERTPVQRFVSSRQFADIPLAGRARWLAVDPQGLYQSGVYDDRDPASAGKAALFAEGWTFVWIVEGSRPFVFGELCSPAFIDATDRCPLGEDGIIELESDIESWLDLPERFRASFNLYTSAEQLREVVR